MSQKITKNTFTKGMNLDADISYQPKDTYRECNEFRITMDQEGTMGSLSNVKGNKILSAGTPRYIAGNIPAGDDLILFTYYSGVNSIYRITFNDEVVDTSTLLWTDSGKASEDKLNMLNTYDVKGIYRKEADNIEKIYWIDGNNNYLRYANIAEYLTTDGLIKSGGNSYVSAKTFGTVADITFTEPELVSSGGGGLNAGVVQYSYQLYNKNGSESSFSPPTGLYHCSSSSDASADSREYKGNEQGDETGKSFTFSITLDTYAFDSIRLVSIFYDYYSQLPTISIINEKSIPSTGVVSFTDRGSNYIGSYTIEQFTTLAGLYKAKDITSSKNFLFLANITENYFDIGDYDARAYRFRSTDSTARPHEGNGYGYKINTNGDWEYYSPTSVLLDSGTDWSIPEDANVINFYNDPDNDGAAWAKFELKSNMSTIGGTGKNIEYSMSQSTFILDDDEYSYTLRTSSKSSVLGFNNYASPNNTANNRGYQRDETYRFGIVFFDQYGRESVVKWIGDIRILNITQVPVAANSSGVNKGYAIKPKFTVNNYPTGAVAYKIVRIERNTEDKSIVTSGIVRPTLRRRSAGNNRQPFHSFVNDDMIIDNWVEYDLQEFISPEISFYKNLQVLGNDYLEIHDAENMSLYDPLNNDNTPSDDWNIKIKNINGGSVSTTLEIAAGEIVGPLLENENIVISEFSFYGYYDGDEDFHGIKNTSLIFKPETATNIYSPTGNKYTDKYIRYGIYKRNIQSSQYDGNTYSVRCNNEYIGASEIVTIPSNESSTSVISGYGDTFIAFHEQMVLSYSDTDGDHVFLNIMFPVETSINLNLRHDDHFSSIFRAGSKDYQNLREEGVSDGDEEYSEMYLYNTVYSQENTIKKYFPLPENETFEDSKEFNTRIIVSERKFNGEESDSWLSFLTNNFIDVDANYGEINNIMDYNNNLLFWQDRGFGITDVDPRSLITDNNPGALILGTGAVLSRFDYLSTLTGNTDAFGLIKTSKGIYWYDNINQTIIRYNGKEIERLSKLLGVQSYLNENKFSSSIVGFYPKYDEILFTLIGDTTDTLVFNEMINAFTGFYGIDPTLYININNKLISSRDDIYIWMHDTSTSAYATYYGLSRNYSTIKIPINAEIDIVKVFDTVNYTSYSFTNNILNYDDTFNQIRVYNSYQNTDSITLVPGTNINRKKGLWSFYIPRNAVNVDPSTNPDIFDAGNLDTTQTFKSRIRDTYIYMDFTYYNDDNYRFTVPFIHTKYRANYR